MDRPSGATHILIDPVKLSAWFDAHADAITLYARQRMAGQGSTAEAQDVAQEAFVRLIRQCAAGREPDDVAAWLFTCVRNIAVDVARSESRRRQRERRVAGEQAHYQATSASVPWFSGPGNTVDAADAEFALQGIPADLREVVTLRIWGNMTLAQVAAVTGASVSTVYDRYRAALEQMRRILEVPDVKSTKRR